MNIRLMVTFFGLLTGIAAAEAAPGVGGSSSSGDGSPRAPVPAPVPKHGPVTTYVIQANAAHPSPIVDFINAKALPLPAVALRSELQAHYDLIDALQGRRQPAVSAGFVPGADGHGRISAVNLGAPAKAAAGADEISSQDFGTTNHPFTTARADLDGTTTSNVYPYRASGKLFFNIGNDTYICSASLIRRGVAVTAAHCAASFGKNQFHSNWAFVPAYSNGFAPYGVWSVKS